MDIDAIVKQVTEEVCSRLSERDKSADYGKYPPSSMGKYIDHTILRANAREEDVKRFCDEAKKYNFASVCVNSGYIKFVAKNLEGSGVKACSVIGFPLGQTVPEVKAFEAVKAIEDGAQEVDMVINIGAIKNNDWKLVARDIEGVVAAAKGRAIVKVILETCLLTDEEKVKACAVSKLKGADFVKTSSGFSSGGATLDDIKLMRQTVGPDLGVKASTGVKTYTDAVNFIEAGATRLGTSSGIDICTGVTGSTLLDRAATVASY
jgi:deoxyribose-phosphate aldolase